MFGKGAQMRNVLVVLAVIVAASFAGNFRLETPVSCGGTDDVLSYDDGSAHWLTWGGLYRGVWFDVTDFDPSKTGLAAAYTEYWFFHHTSYPWDTASFYAELWNGDAAGPSAQLNQTSMIATHYAPVHANYSPVIETEADFWGLVNTSMSSGGWPALLGDNTPNATDHSFYSDDFIIWEPWIVVGASASDYFVRASGTLIGALDSESWGAIKGLYR
jgi:hypothetical protein